MASLESINEKLQLATKLLDQAASEIADLPLEPSKRHVVRIGEALANIVLIQHEIFRLRPDLQPEYPPEVVPKPDPDLTLAQKTLVERLTEEQILEIDNLLLSHATRRWRKVAMLVGLAMMEDDKCPEGIPDVFYSQRIRKLVEEGRLESQGNLQYMRFSEVRLPGAK